MVRYSPTGDAVLISNREGMWLADAGTGAREKVVAANDSSETLPRVTFAGWSADGRQLYLTFASRQKWERGILRYDRSTKQLKELVKDGRSYSQLRLSKDGNTIVMSVASGNRPADLYASSAEVADMRRLVETNPQLASRKFGPTELVTFLDADGHPKKMVVYYPADYDRSKTYPTVFEIYEDFFDDYVRCPRERADRRRLRGGAAVGGLRDRLSRRGVGQGRHGRRQQAHRDGRRRFGAARRARARATAATPPTCSSRRPTASRRR